MIVWGYLCGFCHNSCMSFHVTLWFVPLVFKCSSCIVKGSLSICENINHINEAVPTSKQTNKPPFKENNILELIQTETFKCHIYGHCDCGKPQRASLEQGYWLFCIMFSMEMTEKMDQG